MHLKNSLLLCTLLLGLIPSVWSIEPFTSILGIGAIVSAIFSANYIKCRFYECCDDRWIVNNITGLSLELEKQVYGQHLVKKAGTSHIQAHTSKSHPVKALVLSFHGPTGTGKNHVSRIIAEALYKEGLQSDNVQLIPVTNEFPHQRKISKYKDHLKDIIEKQVKKCPQSMFIFDEVDKMPGGLIDTIKPYVDYHQQLGGVDYRHSIFIFLSNTGEEAITEYVLERWRNGTKREELGLAEIENVLSKAAVNSKSKGGLWHSEIVTRHLVTAFLPFLPLDRSHVRQCIRDTMVSKQLYRSRQAVPKDKVEEVMRELTFYPKEEQLFSVTGCKRVAEKVDYVTL